MAEFNMSSFYCVEIMHAPDMEIENWNGSRRGLSFSDCRFHILDVSIVLEEEDRCCGGVTRRCETRENWVLTLFHHEGGPYDPHTEELPDSSELDRAGGPSFGDF